MSANLTPQDNVRIQIRQTHKMMATWINSEWPFNCLAGVLKIVRFYELDCGRFFVNHRRR